MNQYYEHDEQYDPLMAEIDSFVGIAGLDEKIMQESQITGRPLAECALKHNLSLNDKKWWMTPKDLNDDSSSSKVDFVGTAGNKSEPYDNLLVRMAKTVSACVQFPVNTTLLHGCGIFSAAMIRKFSYLRFGQEKKPVGLYTIAAQPPSSGKSPTNSYFVSPIRKAIAEENEENEPFRLILTSEINKLEAAMKKKPSRELAESINDKKRALDQVRKYDFGYTDVTPEALEESASKQDGRFSIVSDEAEGVTVLVGINYNNGNANLGVVLGGWDGGQQKSGRIGRPGIDSRLFGAVAVMAQESTVAAILRTGRNENGSRGVCERFWILDEPNIIAERNAFNYTPVDKEIYDEYKATINAICAEKMEISLTISHEADLFLKEYQSGTNPYIRDGGKYSDDLMRGVIGKSDTQICKMASVLHCAREWSPSGKRSTVIGLNDLTQAADMYTQMLKCFASSAEDQNIAGEKIEMRACEYKLKQIISAKDSPKNQLNFAEFCDRLKRTKPFVGRKNFRRHCRSNLIPLMVESRHLVFDAENDVVFINPYLKG